MSNTLNEGSKRGENSADRRRLSPINKTGKDKYKVNSLLYMPSPYVPDRIQTRLTGTIIESLYKELQIRTTDLTKANYHTPVASFEMLVPKDHPFLAKSRSGEGHEPLLAKELEGKLEGNTEFYDVGARFGFHTLLMMELGLSESQIHAFEGDKLAFNVLQQNHNEKANLNRVFVSNGNGGFSLDEYIEENNAPTIMKIDVEGAEVEVLRGLQDNIDKDINIYIEVHPNKMREFGYEADYLFEILEESGYELTFADHRDSEGEFVPLSRKDNLPSGNFLLRAT